MLSAPGWFASMFVQSGSCLQRQQQCKLLSEAAPSSHALPPYSPTLTNPASVPPEGRELARTQPHQKCRGNRKLSYCKNSTEEWWLLQKSAFALNGYVTWLISYHICYSLSSSSKSTKCRGKKKEIIIAKDGQISEEALILTRGNRNQGSGEQFPFELSGTEGLRRAEAALGSETCSLAQVLVAMVPLASWQHSLLPQFLSCGQQQERRKNVCILMAAGSLNTMSWKNKEKM